MKTLPSFTKILGIFDYGSKFICMTPLEKYIEAEAPRDKKSEINYKAQKESHEAELTHDNSQTIEDIDMELGDILGDDEKIKQDREIPNLSPKLLSAYEKSIWETNPYLNDEQKRKEIVDGYVLIEEGKRLLINPELSGKQRARKLAQSCYKDVLNTFLEERGGKAIPSEEVKKILSDPEIVAHIQKWARYRLGNRIIELEGKVNKYSPAMAKSELKELRKSLQLILGSGYDSYKYYTYNYLFFQACSAVSAQKLSSKKPLLRSFRFGENEYPSNFDAEKAAYGILSKNERSDLIPLSESGEMTEDIKFLAKQHGFLYDQK